LTVQVTAPCDTVLLTTVDDGKANALSFEVLAALRAAVGDATASGRAFVLAGRPGSFCAGFDLGVIGGGDTSAVAELVAQGVGLFRALLEAPIPVVAACTGHALAAGALLLLSADHRVGPRAGAKIGLTEVAIGFALPDFAMAMARDRLAPAHLTSAALFARVVGPQRAVKAGFLDEVHDDPLSCALASAAELAALPRGALGETKKRLRGPLVSELSRLAP
jgi:enoyl-CoA hydratase